MSIEGFNMKVIIIISLLLLLLLSLFKDYFTEVIVFAGAKIKIVIGFHPWTYLVDHVL